MPEPAKRRFKVNGFSAQPQSRLETDFDAPLFQRRSSFDQHAENVIRLSSIGGHVLGQVSIERLEPLKLLRTHGSITQLDLRHCRPGQADASRDGPLTQSGVFAPVSQHRRHELSIGRHRHWHRGLTAHGER